MDNFNLKKYLVENKLTSNSRMLSENMDATYAICHVEGEYSAPNGEIVDFEEYILIEVIDSENFDETDDSTYDVLEQGELSMEDQEHFTAWNNDDSEYDLRRYSVEEVVERFNTLEQAQEVFETKYRDSKNVYETKTTSNSRLNEDDGLQKYGVVLISGKMLTDEYGQLPYKEVAISNLESSEYGDLEFEGEGFEETGRFDPVTAFIESEHFEIYEEDEDILLDSERSYDSVELVGVFDSKEEAVEVQEEIFEDWENYID